MVDNGAPRNIVVIGNGMVGHKFCEKLLELDADKRYKITTFCEEPRSAYNRMRLTEFFAKRDLDDLSMAGPYTAAGTTDWYDTTDNIEVLVGDKATAIDKETKTVMSSSGKAIPYDVAVIATGSFPFVPPTPGINKKGVFVYRTIEDLEAMIAYQKEHGVAKAAVIGGGLLGLEAAKAMSDLGCETHIMEYAPILMCRQIDEAGHNILAGKIEALGLKIHCNARISEVKGETHVSGLAFSDDKEDLDVGMVIVSAGIRPRDEIARTSGIEVHPRGGIVVDDTLKTSEDDIYAIGECALHGGMIYGLVAPGYNMAEVVAHNIVNGPDVQPSADTSTLFTGADMSTKLKLMGVDVASFGASTSPHSLVWNDPFAGVYKKLFFNNDGTRLLGGILVGDATDYTQLLAYTKSDKDLPMSPAELLMGQRSGSAAAASVLDMDDEAQICSCNNVSKGQVVDAVKSGCDTMASVKTTTKACTGCGGCEPLVKNIFSATMESLGQTVSKSLCEHFPYSRTELYQIAKVSGAKTFKEMLHSHGEGDGCETCKPAVASILASLNNEMILDQHATLQDTNDRSLGNMQRGGSYSVVPRLAGGEITPEKLIAMGEVARDYGLYTKITGGQRIDMFGAERHELPEIWEKLVDAGFESGHAYGKALRTVKSCVGSTWCRYGMSDAIGLAVKLENRYKGLRAPHKIKGGVSGCTRECAEAQSKDFGLIATETGYDLYVCGNGGAQPVHGALLASSIDEDTCIKYLDRFLMYYVATADKLERTARWLERLDGGIDYLKEVVISDKLGINAELENQMQFIVDTYQDEWASVVKDPEQRKSFRQFVNTDEVERGIGMIPDREQFRPIDWPRDSKPLDFGAGAVPAGTTWVKMGVVDDFPVDGGATVKYGESQLAVYRFESRNEWYATQNVCPHKRALVLSQGIIGSKNGIPKVACPLHKKNFSLQTGACLDDDEMSVMTFPVKVEEGAVYLQLPPTSELDSVLGTKSVIFGADCTTPTSKESNSFIPFTANSERVNPLSVRK
ncbi:hypothetical protein JKP88DRAFT_164241 [Tribonema minus]|uniref:Nitrite reductase [NAD(P)H] n=1 Tax=Tribonema minus TaxID=303371 RepID=A0A835YW55_9STRA|nr:hypothetical protein JKP88DRAFT_164241 [Tribonema minus]